jgi:hypothetical protein
MLLFGISGSVAFLALFVGRFSLSLGTSFMALLRKSFAEAMTDLLTLEEGFGNGPGFWTCVATAYARLADHDGFEDAILPASDGADGGRERALAFFFFIFDLPAESGN